MVRIFRGVGACPQKIGVRVYERLSVKISYRLGWYYYGMYYDMNCQKILTADKLAFSGHFVQFCPVAVSPGIIRFLRFQWTLWTNWTLFLLELEKKYFNLYIGLKFCPICPVCPEALDKVSRTKGWTAVDKFLWFCPFCPVLSTNLYRQVGIFMKIYENRKFLQKVDKINCQTILTILK